MNRSEEDLVEKARKGVSGAFEELALPLADRVFSLLAGMVGETDAEDLLQEAFFKAYRGMRGFRGGSSFYTWFTRIAINTARSYIRKKRPVTIAAENSDDGDSSGDPFDALPAAAVDPADAATIEEDKEQLRAAIGRLDDSEREMLLLREVEGFSYEDIAETLDVSQAAVRSKLHRARRRLLGLLEGRC